LQQSTDMKPIYGRCGTVIAWIDDGVIFDMCGRWVAFFDDETVFSFTGKLLGFFEDGWFLDQRGDGVAFVQGCGDDGPVLPVCEPEPFPPALDCPPLPPRPHLMPVSPIQTVDWSLSTWNEFIAGSGTMASIY
jgi:hypothetical protein